MNSHHPGQKENIQVSSRRSRFNLLYVRRTAVKREMPPQHQYGLAWCVVWWGAYATPGSRRRATSSGEGEAGPSDGETSEAGQKPGPASSLDPHPARRTEPGSPRGWPRDDGGPPRATSNPTTWPWPASTRSSNN